MKDDHFKRIKAERRRLSRPIIQPQKPDRLTAKADNLGQWKRVQVEELLSAMLSAISATDITTLAATFVDPTRPIIKVDRNAETSVALKSAATTNPVISSFVRTQAAEVDGLSANLTAPSSPCAAESATDASCSMCTSGLNAQPANQAPRITAHSVTPDEQPSHSPNPTANGRFQSAFREIDQPDIKNFVLPPVAAGTRRDVELRARKRAKNDPTGFRYFTLSPDLSAKHKLTTIGLDNHVELCERIAWLNEQSRGLLNLSRDQSRAWESQFPETLDWEGIRRLRLSLTEHVPETLGPWSDLLVAASECACDWTRMVIFLEAAGLLRRWMARFLKQKE